MNITLGQNNYGKSSVRLLRVFRGTQDEIKDLTFSIQFEGDFETAHRLGDNRKILPTDTMKNTVYVLARQFSLEPIDAFALRLIEHFLTNNSQVSKVRVLITEKYWDRLPVGGGFHRNTFTSQGSQKRTSKVEGTRNGFTIGAGIEDLIVLKTAGSAFERFLRDEYTTLRETRDRILSTNLRAEWLYESTEISFSAIWHAIRKVLLENFAEVDSQSLQHTLYAMGEAVLSHFDVVREIRLSLPNQHYNLVDLSHFGLSNANDIFLPTAEPYGLIEATLKRT